MKSSLLLFVSCLLVACGDPTATPTTNKPVTSPTDTPVAVAKKPSPGTVPAATTPAAPKIRPGEITGIDMGRVFTMTQTGQIHLVDCRPPIFYRMGHIDGAVNLPLKSYSTAIQKHKAQLDQAKAVKKVIVLYCQNLECPDAYAVAKKLVLLGYSVSIYKGGWEEWKRAGF